MRRVAAPIFIVLGAVLLFVSLLTVYANALVVSDAGFADHAVTAIQDPGVQSALSGVITNKIVAQLPLAYRLAQPLIEKAVTAVLASDQFHKVFREVLFRAHHAALSERNNKAVLNLAKEGTVITFYLTTLDPSLGPASARHQELVGHWRDHRTFAGIRALIRIKQIAIIAPILALLSFILALAVSITGVIRCEPSGLQSPFSAPSCGFS